MLSVMGRDAGTSQEPSLRRVVFLLPLPLLSDEYVIGETDNYISTDPGPISSRLQISLLHGR